MSGSDILTDLKDDDILVVYRDTQGPGRRKSSRILWSTIKSVVLAAQPTVKGDPGPSGEDGAAGRDGTPGKDGAPGPIGPVGPQGDTGPRGATGAQGPAGPKGADGAQGATGQAGAKGDTGPIGATGPQGPTGPQGGTGAAGARGETGATGAQGPKGDVGPQGATGPAGASGKDGTTIPPTRITVTTDSAGIATVAWPKPFAAVPDVDVIEGWSGEQMITGAVVAGTLTTTGCKVQVMLSRATLLLSAGPFQKAGAGISVTVRALGLPA